MRRPIQLILLLLIATNLSGCSGPTRARTTDSAKASSTSQTPTEDPNKFTCKKLCKQTEGCPVSSAHCKKERDPAVCWSFYYTDKSRQRTCYHKYNNQKECPEALPVYCNAETEEVLPNYYPTPVVLPSQSKQVNEAQDRESAAEGSRQISPPESQSPGWSYENPW